MQRIGLDFLRQAQPKRRLGFLLLLIGILALGAVVGWNHFHWQRRLAENERELRAAQAALAQRRPATLKISDTQLAAEWGRAMAVAGDLNRPWERLFAIFESAAEMPVGILSFEPDVAKGELVLTAEARNFDTMLAYYRMLQRQENLSAVVLHTHQVNQQNKDKPIRFRITANWAAKR